MISKAKLKKQIEDRPDFINKVNNGYRVSEREFELRTWFG